MIRHSTLALACVVGMMAGSGDAYALAYKEIPKDADGRRVLLAYDCGFIADDPPCAAPHPAFLDHFDVGEELRLRTELAKGPFAEVWLLSGGGVLDAGIAVAQELYRRALTVRVPNAARLRGAGLQPAISGGQRLTICVSSCTVAFMGGQFRFIDLEPGDEATYEVHAGSFVAWGNLEDDGVLKAIKEIAAEANKDLPGVAAYIATRNRTTARRLFALFQDTVWLMVKKRTPNDPERRMRDEILRQPRAMAYQYPAAQQARDAAIREIEGLAALQDILMRIERESMMAAIDELRQMLPSLGRRADVAVAMVAAMYGTSSILETNRMPRETLLKMGYITEFISQP